MAPTVMASSATSVAPFQGLKSTAGLPVSRRNSRAAGLGSVSNGGRIRCMQRLIRSPTGEDEVTRGDNSRGSRRRYRRWKRRTWIGLTISPNSTCLEPMIMSKPFTTCQPNWKDCKTHSTFTMLQIFSLKLAHSVVDGPVHLYGYMAVRDLLNPLRNYIFNRTRADPFIVERGGFIQMSGPKRGITMEAMVLTEFDMKIRRGKEEGGDLQLIDGAIVFNNFSCRHARVNTQRIHGDSGAVDISFALLHRAVEATVQVEISELRQGSGLSLCLTASHASDYLLDEIRLFDGVIAAGGFKLNRSVVAVLFDSKFVVALKLSQAGGSDHRVIHRLCVCQPALHGDTIFILKLGFTTIQLKACNFLWPSRPSSDPDAGYGASVNERREVM